MRLRHDSGPSLFSTAPPSYSVKGQGSRGAVPVCTHLLLAEQRKRRRKDKPFLSHQEEREREHRQVTNNAN